MAEILGFLSGTGILALVGALIVAFLGQMGWVRRDTARLWGRSAVMVCGAGALYFGCALVFGLSVYGKIEGALTLDAVFRGPYLRSMLAALESPQGVGPVSTVFAWLGFALGKVLFGQFVFCGIALAWLMTVTGLFLLQLRLRTIADGSTARDAAFLLLCLPGSVFFSAAGGRAVVPADLRGGLLPVRKPNQKLEDPPVALCLRRGAGPVRGAVRRGGDWPGGRQAGVREGKR